MTNSLLFIDNYDSFSYILLDYFKRLYPGKIEVYRNDQLSVEDVLSIKPCGIIISPGPSSPSQAGICVELIKKIHNTTPIFGVCLGHQAIVQAFGGKVVRAKPVHGCQDFIIHNNKSELFQDIPITFEAARYHSLIGENETLPSDLEVTARTKDGLIMAISHKTFPIYGVQFHPESIATMFGVEIINNFLRIMRGYVRNSKTSNPLIGS